MRSISSHREYNDEPVLSSDIENSKNSSGSSIASEKIPSINHSNASLKDSKISNSNPGLGEYNLNSSSANESEFVNESN